MFPGQQAPPHRWTDYLIVGRMPLSVAYLFSLVGAVGMTFALAEIDASERGEQVIGFMWVVAPAPFTVFASRARRRRMLWWAAGALAGIALGQALPFLSATFLFTVLFAVKPAIKIPEAVLEDQEKRTDMLTILAIRDEAAAVHQLIEDRYMQRSFSGMIDEESAVRGADERIDRVPAQVSPRGARSKLHLRTGVAQLYEALRAADAIETLVAEQPYLRPLALGTAESDKSKPAKQLNKQLGQIETNLDRSRIQLAVSEGVLKDMGYETSKPVPRPFMLPAPLPPPEPSSETPPRTDRPRPPRSQRRSRF